MGCTIYLEELMEKVKKIYLYIKMVWKEIPKLFWEDSDMKPTIRLVIGAAFIILLCIIFGYSNIPVFNELLKNINGLPLLIISALAYILLNVIFSLPIKFVDRLGGFVDKPIEINQNEIIDFTGGNDFTLCAKVFTTTPFRVENCTLKLVDVINIENKNHIHFFEENFNWNRKEGNFVENKPKTILGNGAYMLCNFARWQENSGKAYFDLWNTSYVEIPVGEYECVIRINGTWNTHDINYEINIPIGFDGMRLYLKNKIH